MAEPSPSPAADASPAGEDLLRRLVAALEGVDGRQAAAPGFEGPFHRFDGRTARFIPSAKPALPLDMLVGIDRQKAAVLTLVRRFASGVSTNHALLWGARGVGKSSLVKAAVAATAVEHRGLKLVELATADLPRLPEVFALLDGRAERVVLLCDDLSFEEGAAGANALKSTLDGGVSAPPENVLIVATSNRRHLMPRSHEAGEDALAAVEDAEESLSLSDRFGLWLGFPPMDQAVFLAAVRNYAARLDLSAPDLERRATQWAQRRGARSGRVAAQFIRELAGELERPRPI